MTQVAAGVTPEAAAPEPAAAPVPPPAAVASWKLVAVLAGGGAFAGLLLVVSYLLTLDSIRASQARRLEDGVREVLGLSGEDRVDTVWFVDGRLTGRAPASPEGVERAWVGRRADGSPAGVAIEATGSGFSDEIRLILGYDPVADRLLAVKVLSSKETPGLGDAIERKPDFAAGFRGKRAPVKGVKPDATPDAVGEVDTITGATISSRAVIRIVNAAVARWRDERRIQDWRPEGPR